MEFIFAPENDSDFTVLQQGDLLIRNDELADTIRLAHPYYADADDYTHFIVLTQSCDLVRRQGKKAPKSRYITLAAVRPFSIVLDRHFPKASFGSINGIHICDKSRELLLRNFLENILHNTVEGFFFIRKDSHPAVGEDVCAFLALSVALRASHYDSCLQAKVAQLTDVFAAKIGWAVGNMYSRVGTPDVEEWEEDAEAYKKTFYDEVLETKALWLSNIQYKAFSRELKKWQKANLGMEPARVDLLQIARGIGGDMDFIAERIIRTLESNGVMNLDEQSREIARNVLRNDEGLVSIIRKSVLSA
jgi:hypothetical protein